MTIELYGCFSLVKSYVEKFMIIIFFLFGGRGEEIGYQHNGDKSPCFAGTILVVVATNDHYAYIFFLVGHLHYTVKTIVN